MSDIEILDHKEAENWSWQQLLNPTAWAAIGLHGLLLVLPIGSSTQKNVTPPSAPPSTDKVKLTEIPTGALPSPSPSPQTQSSPSAQVSASPSPTATVIPGKSPVPSISVPPSVSPKVIPSNSLKPSPSGSTKPSESPKPSPSGSTRPSESPKPSPSNSTKPSESPKPSPSNSPALPFTDLRYPGAQPGAFELTAIAKAANQTPDDIAKVSSFMEREMSQRGYQASPGGDTGNRKVYQVVKDSITKFLTLIKSPKGTVIVLSDGRLPDNLGTTTTASKEELAFEAANTKFQGSARPIEATVIEDKVTIPAAFYADVDNGQPQPAIDGTVKLFAGQTPEVIGGGLGGLFTGFQIIPKEPYGGGAVYQVSQGDFSRFISLVPAKDASGTVVAIWKVSPSN